MGVINRTICVTGGGNTGVGDCPLIPRHIIGFFIVPSNYSITPTEALALQTTLQNDANNDLPSQRIYPVHGLVGLTDNTGELVTETLGYGGIAAITEGKYDWTFRLGRGGVCLQQQLRKYNGKSLSVLLYDNNYVLYGTLVNGNLAGIPLELFYALPFTLSDGSGTTTAFNVRMVMDPTYLNDNLAYLETREDGFLLSTITGLQDIKLVEAAGSAKPVIVVQALAGCGNENLYDLYSDELSEVALWTVVNANSGEEIAITSVATNDAVKGFTITIPATADPVIVSLAPVSELETAGIIGYEGRPLTVA